MPASRAQVIDALRRYDKVVIWGLRRALHSHRYIHEHFYAALRKLGFPAAWVDNDVVNNAIIEPNDLVITVDVASSNLNVARPASYILHNVDEEVVERIPRDKRISLQVYTSQAETKRVERWNATTLFDAQNRMLYQPWGTNLFVEEFRRPVRPELRERSMMYWVGSVWNNVANQGNVYQIQELKESLQRHHKHFVKVRFIPNWLNVNLVRQSFLAPAIAGRWQVENNYLPCRMFKNISYGQLGLSNVPGFENIFRDATVRAASIDELIEAALGISDRQFTELVRAQQGCLSDHTYDQKLYNIARAMAS